MSHFLIYADGGARGNPGPAAIGVVITDEQDKILEKISQYIGKSTNNQAEYHAVIAGLSKVIAQNRKGLVRTEQDKDLTITCYLDSELLVEQLSGRYKIKNEGLKPLFWQVRELVMRLNGKVYFQYIPRAQNAKADKLVNLALDAQRPLDKQNAKAN